MTAITAAYQKSLDLLKGAGGLEARDLPGTESFASVLKKGPSASSNIVGDMAKSTIGQLRHAESLAHMAAEKKADPVELSHAVTSTKLALEQTTTVLRTLITATQDITKMPL